VGYPYTLKLQHFQEMGANMNILLFTCRLYCAILFLETLLRALCKIQVSFTKSRLWVICSAAQQEREWCIIHCVCTDSADLWQCLMSIESIYRIDISISQISYAHTHTPIHWFIPEATPQRTLMADTDKDLLVIGASTLKQTQCNMMVAIHHIA